MGRPLICGDRPGCRVEGEGLGLRERLQQEPRAGCKGGGRWPGTGQREGTGWAGVGEGRQSGGVGVGTWQEEGLAGRGEAVPTAGARLAAGGQSTAPW